MDSKSNDKSFADVLNMFDPESAAAAESTASTAAEPSNRDEHDVTGRKSIIQIVQDLSSDSSISSSDEPKIQEGRIHGEIPSTNGRTLTMSKRPTDGTEITAEVTSSSSVESSSDLNEGVDVEQHSSDSNNSATSIAKTDQVPHGVSSDDPRASPRSESTGLTSGKKLEQGSSPTLSVSNLSIEDMNLAARGLLSKHSLRRLSDKAEEANSDGESSVSTFDSDYNPSESEAKCTNKAVSRRGLNHASLGLMGKKSLRQIVKKMVADEVRGARKGKVEADDTEHQNDATQVVYQRMKQRRCSDAEKRSACKGVMSAKSYANLSVLVNKDVDDAESSSKDSSPDIGKNLIEIEDSKESGGITQRFTCPMTAGEARSARLGIMSKKSMAVYGAQLDEITLETGKQVDKSIEENTGDGDDDTDTSSDKAPKVDKRKDFKNRCFRGQLPMSSRSLLKQGADAQMLAQKVLAGGDSDTSFKDADEDDDSISDKVPKVDRRGHFQDRCLRGMLPMSSRSLSKQGEEAKLLAQKVLADGNSDSRQVAVKNSSTRRISFSDEIMDVDENKNKQTDQLIFSTNELESDHEDMAEEQLDILTEGQTYLGISMLVYMYSHLRETVRQGLTRVRMEDIDVHSCQSHYTSKRKPSYLSKTKTAGSIIRVVIDELDDEDENDADHELLNGGGKEYEKSQTAQFRKWIEDSKVSQLDSDTENMIVELRRKVARHRWKRAISAVRLSYKLSGGKRPKFEAPVAAPGCENENRFVDMQQMLSDAVKQQPKYFKEGSIMDNLIESGIEVVWFSDLTQNDVVYGVCCQREEKKVTVVFRGTVNSHNWGMNTKINTHKYRNPIKVSYPGREDEIDLHSGFALYLMRKRKDTNISKMEEIMDKVDLIGREVAPDGKYKLCITGHSLGGALATLFGFYVAAKPRFSNLKTVRIYTFAAPRVGTNAFFYAYQHLERIGRIRHARFSNTHDIVPLIPSCNLEIGNLQFYQHVGMRVQLHNTGRIGKWRLRHALDVTYPLGQDCWSRLRRIFMNNIFANLTTIKGFGNNHKPAEIQRRLLFASQYKQALASGAYFSDQKRNKVKSLDEYYSIRAQMQSCNSKSSGRCDSVQGQSSKALLHRQKPSVLALVSILLLIWINCISMLLGLGSITDYALMPITALTGVPSSVMHNIATFYTAKLVPLFQTQSCVHEAHTFFRSAKLFNSSVAKEIAKQRAQRVLESTLLDAQEVIKADDSFKIAALHHASNYLFNASSIIDS